MAIILGERSRSRLAGVHPDLVRVVMRAAQLAQPADDFTVLEGVRSRQQMMINYGKGRTVTECTRKGVDARHAQPNVPKVTWLNDPFASPHAVKADGYGHAVDLAPYPIDWDNVSRFDRLAHLMFDAAKMEGVHIKWGADWDEDGKPRERGESDSPHFQL